MNNAIHYEELRLRSTIYVSNLPLKTTYGQLRNFFARHGTVLSTYINANGGSNRKFGLVTFQDPQVASKLISTGKLLLWESWCYISERRNPHKHERTEIEAPIGQPEIGRSFKLGDTRIQVDKPIVTEARIKHPITMPVIRHQMEPTTEPTKTKVCRKTAGECRPNAHPINYKKVVRVEGVPHDWDAYRLFRHLIDIGLPITACLVYDDYDEHDTKQGIVQLPSPHSAQQLCEQSFLQTNMLMLNIVRSAVASIGPVRRSYTGKYSAYSYDDEPIEELSFATPEYPCETYSYSVAEPCEPQEEATIRSVTFGLAPIREWPVSPPFNSSSPGLDDDRINSVTPMSVTSNDCFHSSKPTFQGISGEMSYNVKADACIVADSIPGDVIGAKSTEYTEAEGTPGIIDAEGITDITGAGGSAVGVVATKNGNKVAVSNNNGAAAGVFKSFKPQETNIVSFEPGIVLPKPSTTVIIDNLNKLFTKDARSVAIWMEQFGEVRTSDLVPISEQYYRAYVSFWHPFNADLALRNLVRGDSVTPQFQVRLA